MFSQERFHPSASFDGAAENKSDEGMGAGGDEGTLEEVARREREYLRERLRRELGREPTEEDLSEWLRQHTEGY